MRVIKSRRMRWARHVARMKEGRGVHKVFRFSYQHFLSISYFVHVLYMTPAISSSGGALHYIIFSVLLPLAFLVQLLSTVHDFRHDASLMIRIGNSAAMIWILNLRADFHTYCAAFVDVSCTVLRHRLCLTYAFLRYPASLLFYIGLSVGVFECNAYGTR